MKPMSHSTARCYAVLILVCGLLAGLQSGVAAGIGLATLMSVPMLPFAQLPTLGANTLTSLIPDCYAALDVVSRELTGFIPSVARDPSADRVAVGQTLRSAATAANTAGMNITPAMALPAAADQTIGNQSLTISKVRAFPFSWTGEEQFAMEKGPGFLTLKQDQIAQAMRAAVNEMEADIGLAGYRGASRAYGTAGTTPFASNLGDPAQVRKILDDNGAPSSDRSLVIDTTAGASVRTLAQLTKVNESGDETLLRQGTILNIHGFAIRESAQVQIPTSGTGTSYTSTTAGFAIGTTSIPIITGSGTVLAGDVVTFTGDTNKYVVTTGVAAPGTIVLAAPGLRKALAASAVAMTIAAVHTDNLAFSRNAILLATRLPALPAEGDMALDRETIIDPRSGIALEVAAYPGFRMIVYHISVAWGVSVIKPEHVAILLG
jgi:hypothetical protein